MQRKAALAILLLLTSWTAVADELYSLPTVAPCHDRVCFQIGPIRLAVPRRYVEVITPHPAESRLVAVNLRVPLEAFLEETRDIAVTLNGARRVQHVSIVVSVDARSFEERLKESVGTGPWRFEVVTDQTDVAGTVMLEREVSPRNPWVSQLFVPSDGPRETFYSCIKRRDLPQEFLSAGDPTCRASAHILPGREFARMRLQYSIFRSLLDQRMEWDKKVRSYIKSLTVGSYP